MSPQSSFLSALIVLVSSIIYVSAQDAVCLSDSAHQWGYNSAGQSPCDVAGSLLSVCLGRSVTIVALDPGRIYSGSQASGEGNQCRCSSVYYATLAACAQCQGRNWGTWAAQIANCAGSVSLQTIPISIPAGTVVPSWAYLDYPTVGTFDVDLARAGGISSSSSSSSISSPSAIISTVRTTVISSANTGPTSGPSNPGGNGGNGNTGGTGGTGGTTNGTGGNGNTGGNTGGTGGNTGGGNGNTGSGNSNGGGDDNLNTTNSAEKKTPVGAIVGGVVGGIAAIGLIAGLIAFILIKNKKNANETRPTSMYSEKPGMGPTSPFMAPAQNTMNTGMSQPSPYMAPTVSPGMTGGSQYYTQPGANPAYPNPQLSPQMYPQGQPQQQAFNQQSPFATPPQSSMGIPPQDGSQYGQVAPGGQQPGAYRGVAEI